MQNPWLELSLDGPRVLPCDQEIVEAFNIRYSKKKDFIIQTHLMPEPFIGDPQSPEYLLGLNPGYSSEDDQWHTDLNYVEKIMINLHHKPSAFPFYFFNPEFDKSPGARWWHRKSRRLIEKIGVQHLAQRIFYLELFPYHSKKYRQPPKAISENHLVPSVEYTLYLVRKVMAEKKAIVAMRSLKNHWCKILPELELYPSLFELKNKQNVTLSPNNIKDGKFDQLVSVIKGSS